MCRIHTARNTQHTCRIHTTRNTQHTCRHTYCKEHNTRVGIHPDSVVPQLSPRKTKTLVCRHGYILTSKLDSWRTYSTPVDIDISRHQSWTIEVHNTHVCIDISCHQSWTLEEHNTHVGIDISCHQSWTLEEHNTHVGIDISWRQSWTLEEHNTRVGIDISWRQSWTLEEHNTYIGKDISWRQSWTLEEHNTQHTCRNRLTSGHSFWKTTTTATCKQGCKLRSDVGSCQSTHKWQTCKYMYINCCHSWVLGVHTSEWHSSMNACRLMWGLSSSNWYNSHMCRSIHLKWCQIWVVERRTPGIPTDDVRARFYEMALLIHKQTFIQSHKVMLELRS